MLVKAKFQKNSQGDSEIVSKDLYKWQWLTNIVNEGERGVEDENMIRLNLSWLQEIQ